MRHLLVLLVLFSCSSSRDERILEQSKELHEEALNLGIQISLKINELDEDVDGLNEPLQNAIRDSIEALQLEWSLWESSIVEVPGHEHDHHDHHGHNHDHEPSPDLTPQQVLDIQADLKLRASNLHTRVLNTLKLLDEE